MKDSFIIEKIILNIVNDEWMIKENDLMVACELCHLMLGAGGGHSRAERCPLIFGDTSHRLDWCNVVGNTKI